MSRFVVPDGPTLGYEDTGGEGPAVVFSHGLLMDRSMFAAQVADLRGEYRCITWDERGHGESEWLRPYSYWDCAQDLLALLDHLGVARAVLVGMSQGGFISLRAALLAPQRVRGLAFIDSQAGEELPGRGEGYLAMAEDWAAKGPRREVAELAASIIIGPGEHPDWVDRWLAYPREWVREPFRTLTSREDLTDRLSEVDVPAVVLHGTEDLAIPMERAEALAAGLPRCGPVERIDGGSHASNMTRPDQVTAVLRRFLADLPG